MIITSLGIINYKSFDDQGIIIDNLGKTNLFIGKNNSGKSNILTFLKLLSQNIKDLKKMPLQTIENQYRRSAETAKLKLIVSVANLSRYYGILTDVFTPDTLLCISFDPKGNSVGIGEQFNLSKSQLLRLQTQYSDAPPEKLKEIIKDTLLQSVIGILKESFENLIYIPHFREIHEDSKEAVDEKNINGQNIISALFKMQNPKVGNENERQTFDEIQEFIRKLIGDPNLKVEVPHDKETILIEMQGNRLPLQSFGTGIHELVILCSALAIYKNYTVCIEEPELHLHPDLQRKFLKFIHDKTHNTYFITTHSNIFLDFDKNVNIYHVTHNGKASGVVKASTEAVTYDILDDLGYKASDLLQANSILWVEGPSDRVFLNKWISILDPDLLEGVHYSVMFYGGRLLAHVTMSNDNEDNLIKLLRINRNSIIIIDRDGLSDTAIINDTKTRIENETTRGICWITRGREIENYISTSTLSRYVERKTGKSQSLIFKRNMKIGNVLNHATNIEYDRNKVKYAKEIVAYIDPNDLDILDLRERVQSIILKVKEWNNIG